MLALTLRARLASFPHAYAIAIRLREATGRDQFIIRTGDPLQSVRISGVAPTGPEHLLALVA